MKIRERIIKFMEEKTYKPMLKEELAVKFDIERENLKKFYEVLEGLEKEGLIIKAKNNRFGLIDNDYLVTGRLDGHEKGFGFLISDDKDREDIFIPAENMNGAMNGDRVIVNITRRKSTDKREEGEVLRILERKNTTVVGTFEFNKSFGFVVPDDHKIGYDIFIPKSRTKGAKTNQKVVVDITTWPEARRNPEGKVVEILGYLSEKGTDILSIIRQFDLPEEFPPQEIGRASCRERV